MVLGFRLSYYNNNLLWHLVFDSYITNYNNNVLWYLVFDCHIPTIMCCGTWFSTVILLRLMVSFSGGSRDPLDLSVKVYNSLARVRFAYITRRLIPKERQKFKTLSGIDFKGHFQRGTWYYSEWMLNHLKTKRLARQRAS